MSTLDHAEARLVGSDRVLAVLVELAQYPEGIGLDELSRTVDSPKPTVHRALASLRRAGLAHQDSRGRYVLGDEFLRLAFSHHQARPDHLRMQPILEDLARRFGETAHYAVLESDSIVYRAKVDPPTGAVRLTSTVGGRNPIHSTAVGKLLLSFRLRDLTEVREWVAAHPLQRRTTRTLTSAKALHAELESIRLQGFATDDQENEEGVNCVAVPVVLENPALPLGAVSVSGLAYRTPLADLVADVGLIRAVVNGEGH